VWCVYTCTCGDGVCMLGRLCTVTGAMDACLNAGNRVLEKLNEGTVNPNPSRTVAHC